MCSCELLNITNRHTECYPLGIAQECIDLAYLGRRPCYKHQNTASCSQQLRAVIIARLQQPMLQALVPSHEFQLACVIIAACQHIVHHAAHLHRQYAAQ